MIKSNGRISVAMMRNYLFKGVLGVVTVLPHCSAA